MIQNNHAQTQSRPFSKVSNDELAAYGFAFLTVVTAIAVGSIFGFNSTTGMHAVEGIGLCATLPSLILGGICTWKRKQQERAAEDFKVEKIVQEVLRRDDPLAFYRRDDGTGAYCTLTNVLDDVDSGDVLYPGFSYDDSSGDESTEAYSSATDDSTAQWREDFLENFQKRCRPSSVEASDELSS